MTKKLLTLLFPALAFAFAPLALTGCEEDTAVEDAAEDVEDGAEDVADDIEDGIDDATD